MLNSNSFSGQCPPLTDPANGAVTVTGRHNGNISTYTCNSGFELLDLTTGSDMRTCQPDGTWTEPEPQCICKLPLLIVVPHSGKQLKFIYYKSAEL